LLPDLYDASETNRRFLQTRYAPFAGVLENYRRLVSEAVAPDPFSRQPVRLRDATAAITEYRRATGDVAGCIDLMLEFVEAGTAQTADGGGGDDAYFSAPERKVREVTRAIGDLGDKQRGVAIDRLIQTGAVRRSDWMGLRRLPSRDCCATSRATGCPGHMRFCHAVSQRAGAVGIGAIKNAAAQRETLAGPEAADPKLRRDRGNDEE